jgi:uncharacterized OsmC-like protein
MNETAVAASAAAEKIRAARRRGVRTIELRPSRATGTAVSNIRVTDGMTCEVEEGSWTLRVDLPEKWGGNDRGPNPGVYGRAALGSCLAMTYVRWAAENELPIRSLGVRIEADYDARGELGMADVTPAYTQVRYVVEVESDAPADEVRRVFDDAETRCPYLVVWRDPIAMVRDLRISGTGGA